jgi:lipoprotein-anchoring transpeptidase ErfK/SrfK
MVVKFALAALFLLFSCCCVSGAFGRNDANNVGLPSEGGSVSVKSSFIRSTPNTQSKVDRQGTSNGKKRALIATKKPAQPFIRNHYVLGASLPMRPYMTHAPIVVIVDKGSHFTHTLQLQNNQIVRVYSMSNAVGKGSTPTPPGRYIVVKKKGLPSWIPPKSIDPRQKAVHPYNKDRKNPLGVAAIYLNKYAIALHGTNQPTSIRQSVSHGCVRHSNKDISRLYGMVKTGTVVYIVNRFRGKVLHRSDFHWRGRTG